MWLILCDPGDISALWAYQGLDALGLENVKLITSEMLAHATGWEHRLGPRGASVEVQLATGLVLRNEAISGVLNRLVSASPGQLMLAHPEDQEYASQEYFAFFLSWLHALQSPMLNRPTPQGLSGRWRPESEWVCLASRAGMLTTNFEETIQTQLDGQESLPRPLGGGSQSYTVIVCEEHVIGSWAPAELKEGCVRLSELAETPLLGIQFAGEQGPPWTFAGATPLPDLRLGGQELLDAIVSVFQREEKVFE